MKNLLMKFIGISATLSFIAVPGLSAQQNLPVMKGKKVVASVNGEPVTLDEFNRELAVLQEGMGKGKKVGKDDRSALLNRLINTRLIVQEGKRMGLDELPEIKKMVDVFSRVTLREELMERYLRNIKADEKEVDRIYKSSTQEWRVTSVFFEKEEGAKAFAKALESGKPFNDLAKKFLSEKTAARVEEGEYLRVKEIDPKIVEVVSKVKVGSISPIVPFKSGFVILKLEDIRYSEDPEVLQQARREALKNKKFNSLNDYKDALIKKYVTIRQEVLKQIDYESKEPGFDNLLKEKRVIADIKGEEPVTVGDLTEYLRQQFYHGVQRAIEGKKLNSKKDSSLDEMLFKRVFRKEALRLGLDKTENYQNKVRNYENSVIFGAFVKKVIVPDVKLSEEEVKAYYQKHIEEYKLPEMVKMNSLVFNKREDAEVAIEKLRKGTEFQWLSANAEGKVDKNTQGILMLDGKLMTTKDLPEGVQKAISGVKEGQVRFYASPEGFFYVLAIENVLSSKPQPYEEVKGMVTQRVFDEKVKKAIEDYADKLRAASDVKVYLKN